MPWRAAPWRNIQKKKGALIKVALQWGGNATHTEKWKGNKNPSGFPKPPAMVFEGHSKLPHMLIAELMVSFLGAKHFIFKPPQCGIIISNVLALKTKVIDIHKLELVTVLLIFFLLGSWLVC